jgi:hypothetical protein
MTGAVGKRNPIPASDLDWLLTAQIAVAWAGESGDEERRLGWWRSDLVSEFGGYDLFRRLTPHTWRWAVLQAVREAARRRDAEIRSQAHDPDQILSLYSLGFEIDERIEERLQGLKRSGREPLEVLPGLADLLSQSWDRDRFADWVKEHSESDFEAGPIGRRLKSAPPESLGLLVERLIGALWPLSERYPLPHFRRAV